MLRRWTELLPLFVVRWLEKRDGERFRIGGRTVVRPRPDVYVEVDDESSETHGPDAPETYRRSVDRGGRGLDVDVPGHLLEAFMSGVAAYTAAEAGARYGAVAVSHDPCTKCGHGRLLHKPLSYADTLASEAEVRARDLAMGSSACRYSLFYRRTRPDARCSCDAWEGTETPVPDVEDVMKTKAGVQAGVQPRCAGAQPCGHTRFYRDAGGAGTIGCCDHLKGT